MAMIIKDNKIYILVADSDAVKDNKISISTNSTTETTNYCPPESKADKDLFYEVLGDLNRPVYTNPKKVKEYQKTMNSRIKKKYAELFFGKMADFDLLCSEFISNEVLIANKLFLTGDRPYLQFDGTPDWKKFKKIIYGEVTSIVVEPIEDKYICYPEFHPMFIKKEEYDLYEDVDEDTLEELNIFENFPFWLVSYDNPDYTGKEKYQDYPRYLVRLVEFLYENKFTDKNDLNSKDITWYNRLLKIYDENEEVETFDKTNGHKGGIASLKKYIKYIEFLNSDIKKVTFEIPGKGKNLVVYGTPGCGKSYHVETELLKNHKLLEDNTRERVIRTTFYQDYTNTDFIGQILPYIEKGEDGKDVVTYKFNPGPFALALKEALSCDGQEVALVIEELNRGNAPAIFGDVFQLLDRDKNGISKYAIKNVNLLDWLNKELESNLTNVKIPGNLFIYATMNTSDQNVFTLDTAFKRRWEFKKIKNEFKPNHTFAEKYIPGMQLTWKDFVKSINNYMTNDQSIIGAEDKQIGVYFIDETGMREETVNASKPEEVEEFAYKIFEYLWDDVAKFDRKRWFKGEIKTLDDLIDKYIKEGIKVFNEDVFGTELYNNGTIKKESESSETE